MDIVLILLVVGLLIIVSFLVGAKVGQTVIKGEEIEVNPVKIIDDMKDRKEQRDSKREARHDAEKLDVILENIKNYNGTSIGQKDVPRR